MCNAGFEISDGVGGRGSAAIANRANCGYPALPPIDCPVRKGKGGEQPTDRPTDRPTAAPYGRVGDCRNGVWW
jgi:hypothetical protein